jgi:uncharacterized protein YbjT (DUF2867 family)
MKIVVIGGTGLIGSKVVETLAQNGHEVFAAVPSTGVDTVTGEGLAKALEGAEVVVDVANSPSFEDQAAMDFFQAAGRNITAAEQVAGVRHHIALSVVGTERLQDSGYFRAKLVQERLIKASPIPYTLLHATQFFEFLRGIAGSATEGDTVRLPHTRFQPMAAQDVSAAVAEAALAPPANDTLEIAGPDVFNIDELVARVLDHDNDPRTVITDRDALYFGVKVDNMTLMPGPGARLGATDFAWWLANVPPPPKK